VEGAALLEIDREHELGQGEKRSTDGASLF
jgi:hypothetical protein